MSLMRRSLGVVTSLALVLTLSSSSSSQEFGSITFPTSGAAGGAGRVPDRREGAAQLPVRRSRGRVPGGAQGRSGLCDGLLGRGDEPQPSAVGAAGRREGQGGARPARSHAGGPAGQGEAAQGEGVHRGAADAVLLAGRQAGSRQRLLAGHGAHVQPVARRQRDWRPSTRCRCSARCGLATPASAVRRWPPRSPSRFSRRTRSIPAPRTSSSTPSTIPITRRSALDAARAYAKIAPSAAHALHMPSHIFVQLGMWQDAVDSNIVGLQGGRRSQHAA